MFTGLVESLGTLVSLTPPANPGGPTRILVAAPALAPRLHTGDSIAVSGVCLTALDITSTHFAADLADETVRRTKLARLHPGTSLNLELPTPAGTPLGGHIVQGHVDGVGTLLGLDSLDPSPAAQASTDWRLTLRIPSALTRYVVPQGSLTVDGTSLTVAAISADVVSIAIIPHTYAATALHTLTPGSLLNIEVDVLAKYAERRTGNPHPPGLPAWTLTEAHLLANGY